MIRAAFLDVRLLPWRPRARVMKAEDLRENADLLDVATGADDPAGFVAGIVVSIALWLFVLVAAPVLVLVLAALLLPAELVVVAALAVVVVLARLLGVIPWVVVEVDLPSGGETRTRHRNLLRALRQVRTVNHDRRVRVRWALA